MSQLTESAITMTSLREHVLVLGEESQSGSATRSPPRPRRTPSRRPARSSPSARIAARCAAIPALSSAAPRPNSRPSRSVGSNGSESQSRGRPSAGRRGARRAGRSGARRCGLARDHRRQTAGASTSWTSKPSASNRAAVAVGRPAYVVEASRIGADRRDPDQILEVGADTEGGSRPRGGRWLRSSCEYRRSVIGTQVSGSCGVRSDRSPDARTRPATRLGEGQPPARQVPATSERRSRPRPEVCRGCDERPRCTGRRHTAAPAPPRSCPDRGWSGRPGSASPQRGRSSLVRSCRQPLRRRRSAEHLGELGSRERAEASGHVRSL